MKVPRHIFDKFIYELMSREYLYNVKTRFAFRFRRNQVIAMDSRLYLSASSTSRISSLAQRNLEAAYKFYDTLNRVRVALAEI